MAKQTLAQIKNWFMTRKKPTQGQYWDTWDSFWHKDEVIPVAKVEGLTDILTGKATNESVTPKLSRTDLTDTDDIDFTVDGNAASAHTVGFTGSFINSEGDTVVIVNGLVKSVEKPGLILTFDDIANVPVADASSVADWNTFFDLPNNGTPFTSVIISENNVVLVGAVSIHLKNGLFGNSTSGASLLEIKDLASCVKTSGQSVFSFVDGGPGCFNLTTALLPALENVGETCFYNCEQLVNVNFNSVIEIGISGFSGCSSLIDSNFNSLVTTSDSAFNGCGSLVNPDFPELVTAGRQSFAGCSSLSSPSFPKLQNIGEVTFSQCHNYTNINIPSATVLGNIVEGVAPAYDYVFNFISGKNITLTIPAALMTCKAGNPDGDIQYLQANNTVTIITV